MFEFNGKNEDDDDVPLARDPKKIHRFEMNFEDVIAEPAGMYSFKFVWAINRFVFKLAKTMIYFLLTLIVAPIAVFGWGVAFAGASFGVIWVLNPILHLTKLIMDPVAKLSLYIVNITFTPLFESCGAYWSRIKLQHHYINESKQNDSSKQNEPYIV